MNRFVIVDGLPFLLDRGKTFAVRFDEMGFTVGAEVKLASVPTVTYCDISIKAKCAGHLDSIGQQEEEPEQPQEEPLDEMKVPELKAYAETHGIDLGEAKKKAEILAAIKTAQDVNSNDSDT